MLVYVRAHFLLLQIVVVRAVDTFVRQDGLFVFYAGQIDHLNDIVSLQRKCRKVTHWLGVILKFDYELIILKAFYDFIDH